MRTFPKSLAEFRKLVEERGLRLRQMSINDLKKLENIPPENLIFDSRPATIKTFVQPLSEDGVRVVVRGFMRAHLVPGKHVGLDGFHKQPDGRATAIPDEELNEFE